MFRYESALNSEANSLDMALEIPVHGERLMSLSWNEMGMVKVTGSFYSMVIRAMQKDKRFVHEQALLKRFLRFMTFIARMKAAQIKDGKIDIQCAKNNCIALNESFSWYHSDSESLIKQVINDRLTLVLRGVSATDGHFKRLTFKVENTGNSYRGGNPLELNLFLSSCDN